MGFVSHHAMSTILFFLLVKIFGNLSIVYPASHTISAVIGSSLSFYNAVNRVPHGGRGVTLCGGTRHRHKLTNSGVSASGNLNIEIFGELLRLIAPFICCHHLMLQHERTALCCLEAENISVHSWQLKHNLHYRTVSDLLLLLLYLNLLYQV